MKPIETDAERSDALAALLAGHYPDERGRYGPFGGRYVPETLIPAHERLERGVRRCWRIRIFAPNSNANCMTGSGVPRP